MFNIKRKTAYLLIILIGVLLYSWTVFFGFSYLDDQSLILENFQIINDIKNIGKLFVEDVFFSSDNFYYRPLLNLSFMVDSQISSFHPWFYHISNTFIHIIAVCLLFAVLLELKFKKNWALFLSLFFLIHPALVQAVAWLGGRNDSLLGLFALGSFLFFLKFIDNNKIKNYIFSLLFFILALFTKEAAVFLPVLFLFYYLLVSNNKKNNNNIASLILGWGTLFFVWFILRGLAIDREVINLSDALISVLNFSPALIVGLGKFFLPFNLGVISLLENVNIFYGVFSSLMLLFLAINKNIQKKWLVFGLTWFMLFMLPALLNPDPTKSYQLLLLEHRLYLPFIGLIFIFKDAKFRFFKNKKVVSIIFIFILIVFTTISVLRLPNYKDRLSFWNYATKTSPQSSFAYNNLGAMLYLSSKPDEAEKYYKKALEINPFEPMVHNNLGVIYMDKGEYEKAKEEFLKELEINPGYTKARNNLNNLLILENQLR